MLNRLEPQTLQLLLVITSLIVFILSTLFAIIGYFIKQFIKTVNSSIRAITDSLRELTAAVQSVQLVTREWNASNLSEHNEFKKTLTEHSEKLSDHAVILGRHSEILKSAKS